MHDHQATSSTEAVDGPDDRRAASSTTVAAHPRPGAPCAARTAGRRLGRVDLRASTPTRWPGPPPASQALGRRARRPGRADDAQHPRVPLPRPGRRCSAAPPRSRSTTRRRPSRSPTWPATARRRSAIVEDVGFLERFLKVRDELPDLERIVVLDDPDGWRPRTSSLGRRCSTATTRSTSTRPPRDLHARHLATVIYTSGTTGPPKGVMLTHYNVVLDRRELPAPARHRAGRASGPSPTCRWRTSPSACRRHYLAAHGRLRGHHLPRRPAQIAAYAREVRPADHVRRAPGVGEDPRRRAGRAGRRPRQEGASSTRPSPPPSRSSSAGRWATATDEDDATCDVPRRGRLRGRPRAGRPRRSSSSPSPAPRRSRAELLSWYRAIGVPLSEIYGMSESTGPMTWEPYRVKAGHGRRAPSPASRCSSADDGEVVLPGRQRLPRLPRRPREDRRGARRRRLAPLRRHRRVRRRGLPAHRRPQEGADHHRRAARTSAPPTSRRRSRSIPLVGQACAIGDKRPFVVAPWSCSTPRWRRRGPRSTGIEVDVARRPGRRTPRWCAEVERGVERGHGRGSTTPSG